MVAGLLHPDTLEQLDAGTELASLVSVSSLHQSWHALFDTAPKHQARVLGQVRFTTDDLSATPYRDLVHADLDLKDDRAAAGNPAQAEAQLVSDVQEHQQSHEPSLAQPAQGEPDATDPLAGLLIESGLRDSRRQQWKLAREMASAQANTDLPDDDDSKATVEDQENTKFQRLFAQDMQESDIEGPVFKRGFIAKAFKPAYFVVRNAQLKIYDDKRTFLSGGDHVGVAFACRRMTYEPMGVENQLFEFKLTEAGSGRVLQCACDSFEARRRWETYMDSMNVDNAREMEQRKQAMRETNRAPERALLFIAGACVWHEPANEIINLDSNRHFFDSLAKDEECMRFFFPDVDQDVLFNSGHAEDASASVTSQDDTFGLTDVLGVLKNAKDMVIPPGRPQFIETAPVKQGWLFSTTSVSNGLKKKDFTLKNTLEWSRWYFVLRDYSDLEWYNTKEQFVGGAGAVGSLSISGWQVVAEMPNLRSRGNIFGLRRIPEGARTSWDSDPHGHETWLCLSASSPASRDAWCDIFRHVQESGKYDVASFEALHAKSVLEWFIARRADLHAADASGRSILHHAALVGDIAGARHLTNEKWSFRLNFGARSRSGLRADEVARNCGMKQISVLFQKALYDEHQRQKRLGKGLKGGLSELERASRLAMLPGAPASQLPLIGQPPETSAGR